MGNLQQVVYRAVQAVVRPVLYVHFLTQRKHAADLIPPGDGRGEIPGPDPQRVVFVGEATALGYRTHSQDLGIAAQFARRWSQNQHVGVRWSVLPFPDLTIRTAMKAGINQEALGDVDIVVVMAGIGDVMRFTPPKTWEESITDFLTTTSAALPDNAQIFIAEIPPLGLSGDTPNLLRKMAGAHAKDLNAITRRVISKANRDVTLFPFPLEHLKDLENPDSAQAGVTYSSWARLLVETVLSSRAAGQETHPEEQPS
ncbi:MAG: hypothetical protein JWQ43_3976 [Glaciihabitans sp.]|nr:hypothetical protein [Glaciihabitans sp.]